MLNPRWATLGVASLAMFLTVWASDAAQEPQESAKDAPKATPKKILSQLKQAAPEAPKYVKKVDKYGRAYATGKRKYAVARVWIKPGAGKVTVNSTG